MSPILMLGTVPRATGWDVGRFQEPRGGMWVDGDGSESHGVESGSLGTVLRAMGWNVG